jgi:hypothetical protein
VKKGRHRRFEEARALKRTVEVVVEPCPECGAPPDEEHASWCLATEEDLDEDGPGLDGPNAGGPNFYGPDVDGADGDGADGDGVEPTSSPPPRPSAHSGMGEGDAPDRT